MKMKKVLDFYPFFSLKDVVVLVVIISISCIILSIVLNDRKETFIGDLVSKAQRHECTVDLEPDSERKLYRYTANCDHFEVSGVLNAFIASQLPANKAFCYDLVYDGDTYRGCDFLPPTGKSGKESWQT